MLPGAAQLAPSALVSSVEARQLEAISYAGCMVLVVARQVEAEMEISEQVPSRRRGWH
jgi:hypothetical protein